MIVGSIRVRLLIREAKSLKDKRRVVRSIKDRLRNAFNVSVAEIDSQVIVNWRSWELPWWEAIRGK